MSKNVTTLRHCNFDTHEPINNKYGNSAANQELNNSDQHSAHDQHPVTAILQYCCTVSVRMHDPRAQTETSMFTTIRQQEHAIVTRL